MTKPIEKRGKSRCSYARLAPRAEVEAYDPTEERPVVVPAFLVDALEALEDVAVNIHDAPLVARTLDRMGHTTAAAWIRTHTRTYWQALYRGVDIAGSLRS